MSELFFDIKNKQNGDNLTLRIKVIDYQGFSTVQAVYRASGANDDVAWDFILEPELYAEKMTSYDGTIAELNRVLSQINNRIEQMFGSDATIPQKGVELVKWLLANDKLVESDNKLILDI